MTQELDPHSRLRRAHDDSAQCVGATRSPPARRPLIGRRILAWVVVCGIACGLQGRAAAESPTAPVAVQAQITARILPFERSFQRLAGDQVVIVIAQKATDADSVSAARQMERALLDAGSIGGKRVVVAMAKYSGPAALVDECKARRATAVYLTPGLGTDVRDVAAKLEGTGILSVAAVESYVAAGAVLGVEVVSGKPRMSINLRQAKLQRLDFPSAVLKLARIY